MQQTLPAGSVQTLAVSDISGSVTIQGWEQQSFELTAEQEIPGLRARNEAFVLNDVHGPIALHVPFETIVTIKDIGGPVSLEGIRQVNMADVHGGVYVSAINENVTIKDVSHGEITVREVRGIVHINDSNSEVAVDGAQQVSLNDVKSRVDLRNIAGDVVLWDVSGDVDLSDVQGTVSINDVSAAVALRSVGANVKIDDISGEVILAGVSGDVIMGDISGDVTLREISGEAALNDVSGNLEVQGAVAVRVRDDLSSDAVLIDVARVEIVSVGSTLLLKNVQQASVRSVGNDLLVQDGIDSLRCRRVGNDCQVQGGGNADVLLEQVGSDAVFSGVARVQVNSVGNSCQVQDSANASVIVSKVGNELAVLGASRVDVGSVGSDCDLRDIQGDVQVGRVGASANFAGVGGYLQAGVIGSDAQVNGVHGAVNISNVGNSLLLQADFPPGSSSKARVGGNASVALPQPANLSIRATAGASIKGRSIASSAGSSTNLIYGEGSAHLEIAVGGSLELRSDEEPRSSSSSGSGSQSNFGFMPEDFSKDWADFGREMADFSAEMSRFGLDLGREITESVIGATSSLGADLSRAAEERARHLAQEQARRAERLARAAEERNRRMAEAQARRAERLAHETARRNRLSAQQARRNARLNVRINEREWRMDQRRLERILEQARRATSEGIVGALDAVEQALRNLSVTPPSPLETPMPPAPSEQAVNPDIAPHEVAQTAEENATSGQVNEEVTASPAVNVEQEREAILRMIAEGRITPDEGDMLLQP